MTRHAFYLDGSSCSGCKACQVACKDKHGLPPGISWRRVYEVAGGSWNKDGQSWTSSVFAYYLSVACNHCNEPICVEVCPARAITHRHDGVVLIDPGRCLGCKYCSWACPYDAPQYDTRQGIMGKCTFCSDELDASRAPACVAACPMRVLDYGPLAELQAKHGTVPLEYPFVDAQLTGPALVLTPHASAGRRPVRIANAAEVGSVVMHEHSLAAFTILAQAAVGAFWLATVLESVFGLDTLAVRWLIPVLMAVAVATSLLHLGKPLRAWRAIANIRSSWLSREIALAATFTGMTVAAALWAAPPALPVLTTIVGAGLLYVMGRVYQLRTIPAWNRWSTLARFVASALLLGAGVNGVGLVVQGTLAGLPALAFTVLFVLILSYQIKRRLAFYQARLKRRTA